jgi:hypothetical protein
VKKKLLMSSTLPLAFETEEQFAKRIRTDALKKLRLSASELNKDTLAAAMSLSEQATSLGDLSKKSKPRKAAP